MTDNDKMVDLPWADGTTRTVPEGTVYESMGGIVHIARADERRSSIAWVGVRVLTEAPEPPVKVEVPTGIGAIVSLPYAPNAPGFVLTREGWRGLLLYTEFDPSDIGWRLRNGATVLFEGVDAEDEESEKTDD